MIAMVPFLQCVWHSQTQHCTNKNTVAYMHGPSIIMLPVNFCLNSVAWRVCKQAFMTVTKKYQYIVKLCWENTAAWSFKGKDLLYSLSCASSHSCVKATSLIHFTADTFELEHSRLCQYFHMSLFSKVKHSDKF